MKPDVGAMTLEATPSFVL